MRRHGKLLESYCGSHSPAPGIVARPVAQVSVSPLFDLSEEEDKLLQPAKFIFDAVFGTNEPRDS
jgi:hypothetical protein